MLDLFWSTFLFSKGPRRNVSSFLRFLPVRSFVLPRPCYPAVVSLGTLMGLNARQSEIFKEFKYLSLTRMKPFCTCVKLLHGGRTGNRELSKCPIILVILIVLARSGNRENDTLPRRNCVYITLRVFSPFRLAFTCFHLLLIGFHLFSPSSDWLLLLSRDTVGRQLVQWLRQWLPVDSYACLK